MDLREIRYVSPLTNHLMNKASNLKIPLSGTFELSPVCNFACKMCYVRKTPQEVHEHHRPIVSLEQWLRIAQEAREQGLLYLLLTGGEPFLWPDFWTLYEQLIEMGFLISINTNGSLIDDAAVERLKKNSPTRVNITLYGASDETYEALCGAKNVFSQVDHAICALLDAKITVKLNCSLTPYNAHDLEQIVAYAQEKGLVLDVATYMYPPLRRDPNMIGQNDRFTPEEAAFYHMRRYCLQNGQEQYTAFLQQVLSGLAPPPGLDENCVDPADGKILCRAGKASFWATWDGYLTPCGMLPEPKFDLVGRSFSEVWQELVKESEGIALSGLCSKCGNRQLCHGCAAMALSETGSFSGVPQYLCRMVQAMKDIAIHQLSTGNYAAP